MSLLDWIYPRRCVGCGWTGKYFCERCLAQVKIKDDWICPQCNRISFGGETHKDCRERFSLDGLLRLLSYRNLVRLGIYGLKYQFLQDMDEELAAMIKVGVRERKQASQGREWSKFLQRKPGVVAVPLHWRRRNWRGFNQAEMIGRAVADSLDLEFMIGMLRRKKATKPQVKLGKKERQANVRQAFEFNEQMRPAERVLLVDDVWTTGETMRAAGQVLKQAGVKKVWALTLAG